MGLGSNELGKLIVGIYKGFLGYLFKCAPLSKFEIDIWRVETAKGQLSIYIFSSKGKSNYLLLSLALELQGLLFTQCH